MPPAYHTFRVSLCCCYSILFMFDGDLQSLADDLKRAKFLMNVMIAQQTSWLRTLLRTLFLKRDTDNPEINTLSKNLI